MRAALVAAGRYEDVHGWLVRLQPLWHRRMFATQALAARGRSEEAMAFAEAQLHLRPMPNVAVGGGDSTAMHYARCNCPRKPARSLVRAAGATGSECRFLR